MFYEIVFLNISCSRECMFVKMTNEDLNRGYLLQSNLNGRLIMSRNLDFYAYGIVEDESKHIWVVGGFYNRDSALMRFDLTTHETTVYRHTLPSEHFYQAITSTKDGYVWAISQRDYISRISSSGTITNYHHHQKNKHIDFLGITFIPNGGICAVGSITDKHAAIAIVMTREGKITPFTIENEKVYFYNVAYGADGCLWICGAIAPSGGILYRLTLDGEYTLITINRQIGWFESIITNQEGIWLGGSLVHAPNSGVFPSWLRVSYTGTVSIYKGPCFVCSVTCGMDGNVWMLGNTYTANAFALCFLRITPNGNETIMETGIVENNGGYGCICHASDGNLWTALPHYGFIGNLPPGHLPPGPWKSLKFKKYLK